MANCDFNSPCDCANCRTGTMKATCKFCDTENQFEVLRTSEWIVDRKGFGSYDFHNPELNNLKRPCDSCGELLK